MQIDVYINDKMEVVADVLEKIVFFSVSVMGEDIKLILIWLVAAALFFSVFLNFVNLRCFGTAWKILLGKYPQNDQSEGQIGAFQALATSLSGTIGLGNIAGVAVAISLGGPGAALWMAVMGLFGMSTKFAEVVMGVKYRHAREVSGDLKRFSGGPMYYLRDGFNNRGIPFIGNILAISFSLFAILGSLGAASLFQTNQAYQQAMNVTGGDASFLSDKGWLFGLFMAVIVGLVIIGGIRSIAAVAVKIVPVMGGLYVLAALYVIAVHYQNIPDAFMIILKTAFVPEAGVGGFVGALLMGVQRASFSNEAGLGTAPIAHSAARTSDSVRQGLIGMLGPFIDTLVICMITALVIVITGAYADAGNAGIEGVQLTSRAFEQGLSWFPYVLFLVVFLFAYSTIISWSYYGLKGFTYVFGEGHTRELVFKGVFLFFIIIGASTQLQHVIRITDALVLAMAIPNIIGLYLLAPEIKRDLERYLKKV